MIPGVPSIPEKVIALLLDLPEICDALIEVTTAGWTGRLAFDVRGAEILKLECNQHKTMRRKSLGPSLASTPPAAQRMSSRA